MVPKMWDTPMWEGVWPHLDLWDSVRVRTVSTHWNVQGSMGRTASSSSSEERRWSSVS